MARALEINPITLNRWENDDPRYKTPVAQVRLLEALGELARNLNADEKPALLDLLRVSTVAGVIARAAIEQILPIETLNRLAATPGLGWLGMVAGVGVGAALPFLPRLSGSAPKPPRKRPPSARRPRAKARPQPAEGQALYTLGVDAL